MLKRKQMNRKYSLIFACICLVISSCKNDAEIRNTLQKMYGMEILFPKRGIVKMSKDNTNIYNIYNEDNKIVVYVDSSFCTGCTMRKIGEWNRYKKDIKDHIFTIYIILEKNQSLDDIENLYYNSDVLYPIIVDTCYMFRKMNPRLPKEDIFHTFVLNNENKIVFVGDPIVNQNVEKLFSDFIANERKKHKVIKKSV